MSDGSGSAREQFEREAAALKQIIYEFIDGGHIIMAAQVLEQYALLSPDDPDLDEIRALLYPGGIEVDEDLVKANIYDGAWDTPQIEYEDGSFAEW